MRRIRCILHSDIKLVKSSGRTRSGIKCYLKVARPRSLEREDH